MIKTLARLTLALAMFGAPVLAQTKVGLAHGIISSASTWTSLRSDLLTDGFDVPSPPTLTWYTYISSQATSEFAPFLSANSFGSTSLLAGHSQGGLVARYASRGYAVKGTLTIGTPNSGAPIASSAAAASLVAYTASMYAADATIFYGFSDVRSNSGHYLHSLVNTLDSWEFSSIYGYLAFVSYAYGLISFSGMPVNFADMSPAGWYGSSGFMSYLNANIATEQATYKVAIGMQLDGGYYGGPARLVMNASRADAFGIGLIAYGYYLAYTGNSILGTLDLGDPYYYEHQGAAWAAIAMGNDVGYLPYLWHYDLVGGTPNDGIVPLSRQAATGQEVASYSGYSHLEETSTGRGVVRTWLGILRSR